MSNIIENDLFAGTVEENIAADKNRGGFAKIETSCVVLCKVVMAKQIDSKSSNSKDFSIELETEAGAKLTWKAGWYLGQDGSNKDSKGNEKFQSAGLRKINYLLTGNQSLPVLETAMIKETDWSSGTPQEVTVTRDICKAMVGKFAYVQVVRVRSNKQVDSGKKDSSGYAVWVDGPEERFTNEVRAFFDGATQQSPAEKAGNVLTNLIIEDDRAYCAKNPILDKYKEVASVSTTQSTQAAGFGQATAGFGQTPQAAGFAAPQA